MLSTIRRWLQRRDVVMMPVRGRVYREVQLWTEWACTTPEALTDALLREFLAGQERILGNHEQAEEWMDPAEDLA